MQKIVQVFLIPLFIAVVASVISFGLPLAFEHQKQLSYKIEKCVSLIDQDKAVGVDIQINGKSSNTIYFNRVSFFNTGSLPLKNIPIRIEFLNQDSSFKIYNHVIKTEPKYTFGNIKDTVYSDGLGLDVDLMNKDDVVIADILTNSMAPINIYSKSEGMRIAKITEKALMNSWLILLLIVGVSFSTSFLVYFFVRDKKLKIFSAVYGANGKYIDLTQKVIDSVEDNRLLITINNAFAGADPIPGTAKELLIDYSFGSNRKKIRFSEGEIVILPKIEGVISASNQSPEQPVKP